LALDADFDIRTFLPYLLNQAAEASSLEFQRIYRERYGLLRPDWRVVFHLGMFGRMTASEIASAARMHKTKISRAVQRLSDRCYVTRQRDAVDRRVEHLELTPSGRRVFQDLQEIARDFDAKLVADFPAEEERILRKALCRLAGFSEEA
jgi:DNA-binding MarR family transcriptional regulator